VCRYMGGHMCNGSLKLESDVPTGTGVTFTEYMVANFPIECLGVLTGQVYTRNLCRRIGLFKMSNKVAVLFVGFQSVPETAYFAMHHREMLLSYEVGAQFLLEPFFEDHIVITDHRKNNQGFLKHIGASDAVLGILKHIYNDSNIGGLSSEERYWHMVSVMKPKACVSVFPDREGSQFYGDETFYFRDGLFAASLYTQVPIVDHIIVEATAAHDETNIDILLHQPEPIDECPVFTLEAYTKWRHENQGLIDRYTTQCEARYREHLKKMESLKASNSLGLGLCHFSDYVNIEVRIKRNSYRKRFQ